MGGLIQRLLPERIRDGVVSELSSTPTAGVGGDARMTNFLHRRKTTWVLVLWSAYVATWAGLTGPGPAMAALWWFAGTIVFGLPGSATGRSSSGGGASWAGSSSRGGGEWRVVELQLTTPPPSSGTMQTRDEQQRPEQASKRGARWRAPFPEQPRARVRDRSPRLAAALHRRPSRAMPAGLAMSKSTSPSAGRQSSIAVGASGRSTSRAATT